MPAYIIHHGGVYNIYSTISDGCWFKSGLTLDQLRDVVREERGRQGSEAELPDRLERAHETGCSGFGWSLDSCISGNRAGPEESKVARDEFINRFLTLADTTPAKEPTP